mmetsp:Transcript_17177/g.49835  ORF Transcript_17177/g.49835 Transcript_17177/m.49835 type:complete len:233 (+) Transcript_17177:1904-2602(+)
MEQMMQISLRWAMSRSTSTAICAMLESRPEVGSSRRMTAGSTRSSCAMQTRLRSPPETPRCMAEPTFVSAHASRRSCRITSSTLALVPAASRPRRRRARYVRLSRTVSSAYTTSSCSTKATRRLSALDQAKPSKRTAPSVSGMRCAMLVRRVVLPEPLGPMSAVSLPALAAPLAADRQTFSPRTTVTFDHVVVMPTVRARPPRSLGELMAPGGGRGRLSDGSGRRVERDRRS